MLLSQAYLALIESYTKLGVYEQPASKFPAARSGTHDQSVLGKENDNIAWQQCCCRLRAGSCLRADSNPTFVVRRPIDIGDAEMIPTPCSVR